MYMCNMYSIFPKPSSYLSDRSPLMPLGTTGLTTTQLLDGIPLGVGQHGQPWESAGLCGVDLGYIWWDIMGKLLS